MQILNSEDFDSIFSNSYLFETNSFFVIDKKTKTYDTSIKFTNFLDYAKYIRDSYLSGHTIIVKNLELVSHKIKKESTKHGLNVNVHMYLVPENGEDSFDYNKDDRDVYIHMLYGHKSFSIKRMNNEVNYDLSEGDTLYIAKGEVHKAIPQGKSCLLSFGVHHDVIYQVPFSLTFDDL